MKRLAIMLLIVGMISSCAYVQTHKNVEEIGCYYEGGSLEKGKLSLHNKNGKWYLSTPAAQFKKSYPVVHDSVFRKNNNDPKNKFIEGTQKGQAYFPISAGTAATLQRTDGYARLSSLAAEIGHLNENPLFSLPGSSSHPVLAQIDTEGETSINITGKRHPEKTPMINQALGKLDFVVVDIPLTIAYNVAIPFMAPFVFFHDFYSND